MKKSVLIIMIVLFCILFVACDPENGSTPTVVMTEYYAAGRTAYKLVTGIELPEIADLGMNPEDVDYATTLAYLKGVTDADNEICFDLYYGDAFNYQTFLELEDFLKQTLGDCDVGFPTGNEAEGREAQWTKDGRWYEASWFVTLEYTAIFLNSTLAP